MKRTIRLKIFSSVVMAGLFVNSVNVMGTELPECTSENFMETTDENVGNNEEHVEVQSGEDFFYNGSGGDITSADFVEDKTSTSENSGILKNMSKLKAASIASCAQKTSSTGVELIKGYEGCCLRAYDDQQPGVVLKENTPIKGTLTIGYGHTGLINGERITWDLTISQEEAEALLRSDLDTFESAVSKFADEHNLNLKQYQFDALVSFSYNVGTKWLSGSSTLRTYLVNGIEKYSDDEVINAFSMWNRSGGSILAGLTRRRRVEAAMFLDKSSLAAYKTGEYVVDCINLAVREGAGTSYSQIEKDDQKLALNTGDKVNIVEVNGYWGRYEAGWIALDYCRYVPDSTSSGNGNSQPDKPSEPEEKYSNYSKGIYKVVAEQSLNVRKGPGTSYDVATHLSNGDLVYVNNIEGKWGQYSEGWISLAYCDTYSINKPEISSIDETAKGTKLSWSKESSADGYYVYSKTGSGSWTKIKTLKGKSSTNYTDTKASNGKKVQYKIYAYKSVTGVTSKSKASKVRSYYHLDKPDAVKINSPRGKELTITWKKNSKATGYEVQYSKKKNFESSKTLKIVSASTVKWTISKLASKKTYYARVRAYKTVGDDTYRSVWGKALSIKVK